ncbi:MAG TPA: sulfotransferase [Balneolaceae bacterium]
MLLPELSRKNKHGLAPTLYFFKGLYRRLAERNREKVFVIGFHKNGTTSLARALQVLGYRVCGFVTPGQDNNPSTRKELFNSVYKPLLDKYDAFEDTAWFIFYKELAEMYPRAKFILNIQPAKSWYKSMVKHFGGYDREIFHWIYDGVGDPLGHKEHYIKKYTRHNRDVKQYFKNERNRFLVMRMPEDFNWDVMCNFLNCKKPFGNFPHANAASIRNTLRRKFLDWVKAKYYKYNKA